VGSRKGSPNKNKHGLEARLRIQFGKDFDVVMNAASIVSDEKNDLSDKERFDCYMKIAPYIYPQKKAIDVIADIQAKVEYGWEKPKK